MKPEKIEFWIDINLPPALTTFIEKEFQVSAKSFYELGFTLKSYFEVFNLAKANSNIIIITTKDIDFVNFANNILLPPKILHVNTGNISNKQLLKIFAETLSNVITIFTKTDQYLVELTTSFL